MQQTSIKFRSIHCNDCTEKIKQKQIESCNQKRMKYATLDFIREGHLKLSLLYLSIIVAICIIQISLTERAISEPAIARSKPVSALHAFGIIIPKNDIKI